MLRYLFILSFFAAFVANAQQTKKVYLCTDDKMSMHNFSFWSDVQVKGKDTSISYILHSNKKDVIELKNEGTYTFTFTSVFGDKITREITLGKKTKYTLKVKGLKSFYKQAPTTTVFSEQLKAGDTLYLIYSDSGKEKAFEKMAITKLANGNYKTFLFKEKSNEVFMEYGCNENSFAVVKNTEKQIKEKKQPACSPDVYTFCLGNVYYSIKEPSCQYKALDIMKARLLLVEGK